MAVLPQHRPKLLAVALVLATVSGIAGRSSCAAQQVLDRVMASVNSDAITLSDAEEEYRFELFTEGQTPHQTADSATLQKVCERLVDQNLLSREAADLPLDEDALKDDATQELNEIRKKFGGEEGYRAALRELKINEQQVLARLIERRRILAVIDQRLRATATPDMEEVEFYYRETFVPEFKQRNQKDPPPLPDVEDQIREILVQKKIDQLLGNWLEELKSTHRVRFHSF